MINHSMINRSRSVKDQARHDIVGKSLLKGASLPSPYPAFTRRCSQVKCPVKFDPAMGGGDPLPRRCHPRSPLIASMSG
jgi:hypothetical protein